MSKWFGKVGFMTLEETTPSVWKEKITTREYYGDVLRKSFKHQSSEHLNDDLTLSNQLSIVADEYMYQHCSSITFVEWMGAKWKVTSVEPDRPRIKLDIGGVYNGPQT